MLDLIKKKRFIKSLKKYRGNKEVLQELKIIIEKLVHEKPLPAKYRDHVLKGDLKDLRELHVKPDTLLLYFKIEKSKIVLVDIGNHNNLFKK